MSTESPLIIRALAGEKTSQVPIWLMRQAGRYLPEYRALRKKYKMLELLRAPELAAEVTLQPLKRFELDAAIIFADILTPLIGMGIELDFIEGEGPKIFNPVRSAADIEKLKLPPPEENVGYTLEALRIVSKDLVGKPVLGFSGAPFTLATYLVASSGSGEKDGARKMVREDPALWCKLQDKLIALISSYLIAQVRSGASAVQLFDSWVGALSPTEFSKLILPGLQKIVATVRRECQVPIIYFSTESTALLPEIGKIGVQAVGLDWRVQLDEAYRSINASVALQGNLDPALLSADGDEVERQALHILEVSRAIGPFVFNLGHGILPSAVIENVERLIGVVHRFRR